MGRRKVTKQQIQAAEKGKAKAAKRQARDDAYRAALGLAKGAKLPNTAAVDRDHWFSRLR